MKNRLSYVLFFITFLSFAQNKFEAGYYIDNSGVKTECLIKNYDWKNNPSSIETIISIDDNKVNKKNIDEIIEFGINNKSKFIKTTVKIDQSSQNLSKLTSSPSTNFMEKTVLLKVLVEGISNLYYFENEDYERFFYSKNDIIEQLVYKKYNNVNGNISINESFKQQLFVNFKCNTDQKKILALKYNESDLVDYFIKTNNCLSGTSETKVISVKRKFETNFKVNLLLNTINTHYIIPYGNVNGNYEPEKRNTVSFGFEAEVILPYNNKNWSFIFDPSFVKNKESLKIYKPKFINPDFTLKNNSVTVRLPLGIRRYFKLNKNNSFFTNATLSINLNKTYIDSHQNNNSTKILVDNVLYTSSNFVLGIGYQYKKYTAEFKFIPKTLIYAFEQEEFSFNQMSLKLGYKLF